MFDELLTVVTSQRHLYSDEDGPAFVFQCRTGKGRTTTAMAIAGLIVCHLKVGRSTPGTRLNSETNKNLQIPILRFHYHKVSLPAVPD